MANTHPTHLHHYPYPYHNPNPDTLAIPVPIPAAIAGGYHPVSSSLPLPVLPEELESDLEPQAPSSPPAPPLSSLAASSPAPRAAAAPAAAQSAAGDNPGTAETTAAAEGEKEGMSEVEASAEAAEGEGEGEVGGGAAGAEAAAAEIYIPSIPSLKESLQLYMRNVSLDELKRQSSASVLGRIIRAVFVVHFDTREGNKVEWEIADQSNDKFTPRSSKRSTRAELDGVEFKAMPSGIHVINEDFVIFGTEHSYGIACFHKLNVVNTGERCARMRAVGLLARDYRILPKFIGTLSHFAQLLNSQGEYAYDFSDLELFYHSQQTVTSDIPTSMDVSPNGNTLHLFHFYGLKLFTLWKAILLRLRVLFFTPVPVGTVCESLHSLCRLMGCSSSFHNAFTMPNPIFFVNVADIDRLEKLPTYVACTTESIFREKATLYDVYVDNSRVVVSNPSYIDALRLTRGDMIRYTNLKQAIDQMAPKIDVSDAKSQRVENIVPPNKGVGKWRRKSTKPHSRSHAHSTEAYFSSPTQFRQRDKRKHFHAPTHPFSPSVGRRIKVDSRSEGEKRTGFFNSSIKIERTLSAPPELNSFASTYASSNGSLAATRDVEDKTGYINLITKHAETPEVWREEKSCVSETTFIPASQPSPIGSPSVTSLRSQTLSFNQHNAATELGIQAHFLALNDQLLTTLVRASTDGRLISPRELGDFGLHPSDHRFLRSLVRVLRLRVEFLSSSMCLGMGR